MEGRQQCMEYECSFLGSSCAAPPFVTSRTVVTKAASSSLVSPRSQSVRSTSSRTRVITRSQQCLARSLLHETRLTGWLALRGGLAET
jgi:hypothetical protein